jgi:hypothetical protein
MRQASGLGGIFRAAHAKTAASADGSGASWGRRFAVRLTLLSALATLAFAATASAAPPEAEITSITPGYISAHVDATIDPNGAEKNICWFFMVGDKQQIDESPNEWEEYWWGASDQTCFWAEKDEPVPVSTDTHHLRGGGEFYGKLWVYDSENEPVYSPKVAFTLKPVNSPITTIDSIDEVTTSTATFTGTVDPNAPHPASEMTDEEKEAYRTSWEFRCEPGCNVYEWGFPATSGNGSELNAENSDLVTPTTFWAKANNLQANRVYTVYMRALNSTSSYYDFLTKDGKMTFKTLPLPPQTFMLPSAPVNSVTSTGARMVGLVRTRNSELTDCHFEYGTTTSYGMSVPCNEREEVTGWPPYLGFGPSEDDYFGGETLVSGDAPGLEPDTTYHFRLVAANAAGQAETEDKFFHTLPVAPPPPTCDNAAIRVEQKATSVGACRAWEQVSPADKAGGNIATEASNSIAANDGERIAYASRGSFGDTQGSGVVGYTQYMARRTPSGWVSHGILPTPAPQVVQIFFTYSAIGFFSEDLSHALLTAYDLPRVTDDNFDQQNLYWENTDTRELDTISKSYADPPTLFDFLSSYFSMGASADQHVVSMAIRTRLLPEAPEGGAPSVYEWEEGKLRLASFYPDGSPITEGAEIPEFEGRFNTDTISHDGSLVSFYAPKEGSRQLYVRRNATDTVWVSEPEGTEKANPEDVRLQFLTRDSKHVIFTTPSALLDEDTNGAQDLYMYTDSPHPESESNLTLVSKGKTGNVVGQRDPILGASDDGSYIYWAARERLWLYKNGEARYFLSPSRGEDNMGWNQDSTGFLVSSDGKRAAWITKVGCFCFSEEYGLSGIKTRNRREMYVYDDPTESFICASCPLSPAGEPEKKLTGDVPFSEHNFDTNVSINLPTRSHFLTRDGERVFFATPEALVPADKNVLMDVYEYVIDTGEQRLVSSGRGEYGAWYVDSSSDGRDVFISTRDKLINVDHDSLVDLYDARTEGGYAEPPPPPTQCVGDACRGLIPTPPIDPSPATPRFAGPGNPKPKHVKPRHRRQHKKAKKRHKRHSGGHGGGK